MLHGDAVSVLQDEKRSGEDGGDGCTIGNAYDDDFHVMYISPQ